MTTTSVRTELMVTIETPQTVACSTSAQWTLASTSPVPRALCSMRPSLPVTSPSVSLLAKTIHPNRGNKMTQWLFFLWFFVELLVDFMIIYFDSLFFDHTMTLFLWFSSNSLSFLWSFILTLCYLITHINRM